MMKRPDNHGAKRLRELFRDKGGQQKVTDAVGVKGGVVSRWFSGERKPRAVFRAKLEELYGIGWRSWDAPLKARVSPRD